MLHAGKGLGSWLLFLMFIVFCYFPMWYAGSDVVLDCIVSLICHLSYFVPDINLIHISLLYHFHK